MLIQGIPVSRVNICIKSFFHFLEELIISKIVFKIYWPLVSRLVQTFILETGIPCRNSMPLIEDSFEAKVVERLGNL